MAKTKAARPRARKEKAIAADMPTPARRNEKLVGCSDGMCLLCWVFKIMVIVFLTMILFWLGFCFGIASDRSYGYRSMEVMKMNKPGGCGGGVCTLDKEYARDMSHTMDEASMEQMMTDMTAALADKTGADFDKEFAIQMIVHHEGAIEMARMALEKSQNAEVRALAQKIIDAQTAEIQQMQDWQ